MFSAYRNPDADDGIFDCLLVSMAAMQENDRKASIVFVSEALFRLCRGTHIYTLLGCDRVSGHVPRLFILYIFSYFSLWILILLVREKHRKTLYGFLFQK